MRRILKLLIKVDVRLVPCWSTKCRFSLLPNFSAAFIISQRSQTERKAGEKKTIVAELVVFLACSTACGTAATAQKKFLDTQREEEIASTAHTQKKSPVQLFFFSSSFWRKKAHSHTRWMDWTTTRKKRRVLTVFTTTMKLPQDGKKVIMSRNCT